MANTKQVAMRWSEDLLERLELCARKFAKQVPGSNTSRSDVVRILLERGLAAEGFAPVPFVKRRKRAVRK